MPIFGRKKVAPQPTSQPQQQQATPSDAHVDEALAVLSQAVGINLDFQAGYIMSPVLWNDPEIAPLFDNIGIKPNMKGNILSLLTDPRSIRALQERAEDDPLREALAASRFAMVPYDPTASNGYNDGLTQMQMTELRKIAQSEASAEARKYATLSLMMFSEDVMMGKVQLG